MLGGRRVLLIIGAGVAAYKCLDLIRELRRHGASVTPVLTPAAEKFVTPLSVCALAENEVHGDLFDATSESKMGHIQLSRMADLIVVAPATADLIAKMAHGQANDLASTLLLATDTPVIIAPAMNVRMFEHKATVRNLERLRQDGIRIIGPETGEMACGEFGSGRMSEPAKIVSSIISHFSDGPLMGRRALVTSGPTHEPIDPVRYIANRSSGTQGTEIARSLYKLGADVMFVTGPSKAAPPDGVECIRVETAREMHAAVMDALPCDLAIFAAAVADWRVALERDTKMKKLPGLAEMSLDLVQNPDILASVSQLAEDRPSLVVGFAAETGNVLDLASEKRVRKGCDWIVANDVSADTGILGGSENEPILITEEGVETWPKMTKAAVAERLAARIADELARP